jgi:hypothetical protein
MFSNWTHRQRRHSIIVEAVDMNGRFQMREVKLDFAERDKCKQVLLGLSLAANLVKPLCPSMGLNGGSVAMDAGG